MLSWLLQQEDLIYFEFELVWIKTLIFLCYQLWSLGVKPKVYYYVKSGRGFQGCARAPQNFFGP